MIIHPEIGGTAFRCRFNHTVEEPMQLLRFDVWRQWAINQAIVRAGGDVAKAANLMGLAKTTVYRWLKNGEVQYPKDYKPRKVVANRDSHGRFSPPGDGLQSGSRLYGKRTA